MRVCWQVGLNLRKGVLTTVDHGDALLQEVWEVSHLQLRLLDVWCSG